MRSGRAAHQPGASIVVAPQGGTGRNLSKKGAERLPDIRDMFRENVRRSASFTCNVVKRFRAESASASGVRLHSLTPGSRTGCKATGCTNVGAPPVSGAVSRLDTAVDPPKTLRTEVPLRWQECHGRSLRQWSSRRGRIASHQTCPGRVTQLPLGVDGPHRERRPAKSA